MTNSVLVFSLLMGSAFAQDPVAIPFGAQQIGKGIVNKSAGQAIYLFCVEKQKSKNGGEFCSKSQFGISGYDSSQRKDIFGNESRFEGLKELGPVLDLYQDATIYEKLKLSKDQFIKYFTDTSKDWQFKPFRVVDSKFNTIRSSLEVVAQQRVQTEVSNAEQLRIAKLPPFALLKATANDLQYSCVASPCWQGDVVYKANTLQPFYVLKSDATTLTLFDGENIFEKQDKGLFTISISSNDYVLHTNQFLRHWRDDYRTHLYSDLVGLFTVLKVSHEKKQDFEPLVLVDIRLEKPLKPTVKAALEKTIALQQPDELLIKGISLRFLTGLKSVIDGDCGFVGTVEERKKDCELASYVIWGANSSELAHLNIFKLVTSWRGNKVWEDRKGRLWFNHVLTTYPRYMGKICERPDSEIFQDYRFSPAYAKTLDQDMHDSLSDEKQKVFSITKRDEDLSSYIVCSVETK